jgi:hypothetical protein
VLGIPHSMLFLLLRFPLSNLLVIFTCLPLYVIWFFSLLQLSIFSLYSLACCFNDNMSSLFGYLDLGNFLLFCWIYHESCGFRVVGLQGGALASLLDGSLVGWLPGGLVLGGCVFFQCFMVWRSLPRARGSGCWSFTSPCTLSQPRVSPGSQQGPWFMVLTQSVSVSQSPFWNLQICFSYFLFINIL